MVYCGKPLVLLGERGVKPANDAADSRDFAFTQANETLQGKYKCGYEITIGKDRLSSYSKGLSLTVTAEWNKKKWFQVAIRKSVKEANVKSFLGEIYWTEHFHWEQS